MCALSDKVTRKDYWDFLAFTYVHFIVQIKIKIICFYSVFDSLVCCVLNEALLLYILGFTCKYYYIIIITHYNYHKKLKNDQPTLEILKSLSIDDVMKCTKS